MRIDIHEHPHISSSGSRWLDLSIYRPNGIVIKMLSIDISVIKGWLNKTNYNHIEDSEGEVINLDPITYIYSDLFINNFDHQKELIRHALEINLH
jgi:hypothetical protein